MCVSTLLVNKEAVECDADVVRDNSKCGKSHGGSHLVWEDAELGTPFDRSRNTGFLLSADMDGELR